MNKKRKKLLSIWWLICLTVLSSCAAAKHPSTETSEGISNVQTAAILTTEYREDKTDAADTNVLENEKLLGEKAQSKEKSMKLQINGTPVEVTWEDNETVKELMNQAESADIVVKMNMYGGWEQVGSLGRSYPRNDKQITAVCGDIVLYSGNQIVVFYGSNDWAYTRLGKMNIPKEEVNKLLSNGNVTLTLTAK